MATAPPPQRQSVLSERSTTGLTLLDLLEMTPDEIEAHLRSLAPQPEPAMLRPSSPEAQPAGLIGAELRPMNQPRDVLGEAMAEGSPPVPWVAGYAMLAGRPEDEALMWDTAAGHLGQAMTAHVALPYREFDQTISGETPLTRRRTIPAPEGEVTLGARQQIRASRGRPMRQSGGINWFHGTSTDSGLDPNDTIDPAKGMFESTVWATADKTHADRFARSRSAISEIGGKPVTYRVELAPWARTKRLNESLNIEKDLQKARDEGFDALEIRRGENGSPELAILSRGAAKVLEVEGEVTLGSRRPRRSVAEAAARAAQAEAELVGENLGEAVGPTLRSLLVPAEGEAVGAPIYSQARKIVEDPKTQATQTGEAWLRFLSDPKRGVKAEEFQYTGLGDLLKGKAGQRVTREEILGHLDANQIEVKEVTKGAPHEVTWEPDADYPDEVFHGRAPDAKKPRYVVMKERSGPRAGKWIMEDSVSPSRVTGTFDTQEAAQRAATYALGLERSGQPKFSQYALPGAENYREVLLTLPPNPPPPKPPAIEIRPAVSPIDGSRMYEAWVGDKMIHRGRTPAEARTVAESNLAETAWGRSTAAGDFRSGHWDEPNVLAHLRLSDRTDADGKRVLLVEELQSDWGQKGRREGFAISPKEVASKEKELVARHNTVSEKMVSEPFDSPNYDALRSERDALRDQLDSLRARGQGIPDAPFVKDTSKWTALGLKRVLKMAADEGYDRVGIVRGEEQAARYDLSKQVDSVRVVSQGNDQFTVEAMKNGERVVHKTNLPKSELADTIGKDLADQALTQIASGPKTAAEFKGESLRIGGEGMKGYYDKIVPETLNKLAKEYGVKVKLEGGKVKPNPTEGPDYFIESAEDGTFAIIDKADEMGMPVKEGFATKAEAQKYMRELDLDSIPIHTLDVPESMKKSIKTKGFPLYSRQENLGTLMRNA